MPYCRIVRAVAKKAGGEAKPKVTVRLPRSLVMDAKVAAVKSGTSLQSLIEAGLRRELGRGRKRASSR